MLHSILWKFILIAYTQVDTDNRTFDSDWVLISTIRRLTVRIEAHAAKYRVELERYRSRGETPPPSLLQRYNKHLLPNACLTATGHIRYVEQAREVHEAAGCYLRYPPIYFKQHDPLDMELHYKYPPTITPNRWSAVFLQQLLQEEADERASWHESNLREAVQARKRIRRPNLH